SKLRGGGGSQLSNGAAVEWLQVTSIVERPYGWTNEGRVVLANGLAFVLQVPLSRGRLPEHDRIERELVSEVGRGVLRSDAVGSTESEQLRSGLPSRSPAKASWHYAKHVPRLPVPPSPHDQASSFESCFSRREGSISDCFSGKRASI